MLVRRLVVGSLSKPPLLVRAGEKHFNWYKLPLFFRVELLPFIHIIHQGNSLLPAVVFLLIFGKYDLFFSQQVSSVSLALVQFGRLLLHSSWRRLRTQQRVVGLFISTICGCRRWTRSGLRPAECNIMDLMDMLLSSKSRAVATVTLLFFLSVF